VEHSIVGRVEDALHQFFISFGQQQSKVDLDIVKIF
jgi:hypothetical protein